MTAARRHRTAPTQPELPLPPSPTGRSGTEADSASTGTPTDDPTVGPTDDGEWRLDERTRQVGLRGVAFARAQLLRSEATREAQLRSRGRGPSGRAA